MCYNHTGIFNNSHWNTIHNHTCKINLNNSDTYELNRNNSDTLTFTKPTQCWRSLSQRNLWCLSAVKLFWGRVPIGLVGIWTKNGVIVGICGRMQTYLSGFRSLPSDFLTVYRFGSHMTSWLSGEMRQPGQRGGKRGTTLHGGTPFSSYPIELLLFAVEKLGPPFHWARHQ